jgi:hypothetical protein
MKSHQSESGYSTEIRPGIQLAKVLLIPLVIAELRLGKSCLRLMSQSPRQKQSTNAVATIISLQ